MSNNLELLKSMTTIVSDTGDILSIKQYQPQDATTNPSLILKAAKEERYRYLIEEAVSYAKSQSSDKMAQVKLAAIKSAVNFGKKILQIIPGRVSTEVDARLSFDIEGSIEAARTLIKLYEEDGIDRSRILIKLAATWEGIVAARQLQKENINCNMTLIFNLAQAIASAEAKAFLISPFVGRIYDWYKKSTGLEYTAQEDPGVISVKQIYNYLRKYDYPTIIMGASFRNVGQITALAGCDYLTISPGLLEELKNTPATLTRRLSIEEAKKCELAKEAIDEKNFRFLLNEDAMATEKLAEGIRVFAADIFKLENEILKPLLA